MTAKFTAFTKMLLIYTPIKYKTNLSCLQLNSHILYNVFYNVILNLYMMHVLLPVFQNLLSTQEARTHNLLGTIRKMPFGWWLLSLFIVLIHFMNCAKLYEYLLSTFTAIYDICTCKLMFCTSALLWYIVIFSKLIAAAWMFALMKCTVNRGDFGHPKAKTYFIL